MTGDYKAVNAVRALSVDMVNKANSGHPGLPMGAAPMAYVLWAKIMKQNPKNSQWINRDRFVLSAGHGSALLYSLLHLSGFDVSLDDIKNFRQMNSKTPGHPEVHYTDGVEATTGPLGQGFANAVGMAMAEAHDAAIYNKEQKVVDHFTYVLCGDGCLMEGVTQEAASLAGHLKLGKLIVLYDSNDISLDGPTSKSFTENVGQHFESYGWEHIFVKDGEDLEAIEAAIKQAQKSTDKPTLVEIKTVIGRGSKNEGSNLVHGAPIGEEDGKHAKEKWGWDYAPFEIPEDVRATFKKNMEERGQEAEDEWNKKFEVYQKENPALASQLIRTYKGELPENWAEALPVYNPGDPALASRKSSEAAIQAIAKVLPEFWGGSADLSMSNNTMIQNELDFEPGQYQGRNIWYGVREFAMMAAVNGIMLHGGSITYGATFFVFSDYARAAMRVAALSKTPAIYVFTHDSVAVGEDGPTHEPIEHLASFRVMPNINMIRPADGNEVSAAWKVAVESKETPTVLALSRQNLAVLENSKEGAFEGVARGAYVISHSKNKTPEGILIATGSEVSAAIEAQALLAKDNIDVSVVSMPCQRLFDLQDDNYKESVLPKEVTHRMSIEMGTTYGWQRYVGCQGVTLGIDRFGVSAPGDEVIEMFGFTPQNIAKEYRQAFGK